VSSPAAEHSHDAPAAGPAGARSPQAQLLHALNQPLTGLQCSMEVALAMPRTPEQYTHVLREGLQLTERMRALVGALREVTDAAEEQNEHAAATELNTVLQETVDELKPVAEMNNIRVTLECAAGSSLAVRAGRRRMAAVLFRFLESALSLAARGTVLLIVLETGAPAEASIRVRWQRGRPHPAFAPSELGLMVAQASLERTGAVWQRERTETFETVTVRFTGAADNRRHS
jgi:signal transduction histidine kinase